MKFLIILTCIFVTAIRARTAFKTIVQWKQLYFEFPDECEREIAIKEGRFIPENCVPYDMGLQYKGQLKLTMFMEMFEILSVFQISSRWKAQNFCNNTKISTWHTCNCWNCQPKKRKFRIFDCSVSGLHVAQQLWI